MSKETIKVSSSICPYRRNEGCYVSATPHSFSSIVLKFCRCFVHGLKMSMGFGHYFSLFSTCELRH